MQDLRRGKEKTFPKRCSRAIGESDLYGLYSTPMISYPSITGKFRYTVEEDEDFYLSYFPPFYNEGKLYHFYSTDALLTFLMIGYNLERMEVRSDNIFAALSLSDERVRLFTYPDTFVLRFRSDEEALEMKIEGYSTIAFYRDGRMRGFRVLELKEINQLFVKWLEKYVSDLLGRIGRQESYTKSYVI